MSSSEPAAGRFVPDDIPHAPILDLFDLLRAYDPTVRAAKAGTVHEAHDGWQMSGHLLGRLQCQCGDPLDDLLDEYHQNAHDGHPKGLPSVSGS